MIVALPHTDTQTHRHRHRHTHALTHVRTHIRTNERTHARTHKHRHRHTRRTHAHTCTKTRTHVRTHRRAHTSKHRHTHARTHARAQTHGLLDCGACGTVEHSARGHGDASLCARRGVCRETQEPPPPHTHPQHRQVTGYSKWRPPLTIRVHQSLSESTTRYLSPTLAIRVHHSLSESTTRYLSPPFAIRVHHSPKRIRQPPHEPPLPGQRCLTRSRLSRVSTRIPCRTHESHLCCVSDGPPCGVSPSRYSKSHASLRDLLLWTSSAMNRIVAGIHESAHIHE